MTRAMVGLGGNRGMRHVRHGALLLRKLPGARLVSVSPFYSSAPVGCPGRQREYINCAAELQTILPPGRLHLLLKKVEKQVQHRHRRRNAPRRLDVDYLMHGNARLRGASLILPHPRLCLRAFVLMPLADIAGVEYEGLRHAGQLRAARKRCSGQSLHRLS